MSDTHAHDRWANTPVPPALVDPPFTRGLEIICIVGGSLIILTSVVNSIRYRRLTYGFLFLTHSLFCYWQETVGDWGQHLIYSPKFARHRLLEWLPLKSPNDPWFIPFSYAVYWTAHSLMLMSIAPYLQRHFRKLSLLQAVIIVSLPLNYAFDIVVEGFCTYMGWWTYDPGFGPVIQWPGGGRQPLTWPILLMSGWPNLIAYGAGKPPLTHLNTFERWFQLHRWTEPKLPSPRTSTSTSHHDTERTPLVGSASGGVTSASWWDKRAEYDSSLEYRVRDDVPRWLFELARWGAWFVVFQVSFFLLLIVPLLGLRMGTGKGSQYIP